MTKEEIISIIQGMDELPGPMPNELKLRVLMAMEEKDIDFFTDLCRAVARATKKSLQNKIEEFFSGGENDES